MKQIVPITIVIFFTLVNFKVISQCTTSTNISQGKTASQSTNFDPPANSYPASNAVNGTTTSSADFSHTGSSELQPWIQIDLGSIHNVTSINIYNRTGCAPCSGRLKKFKVFISSVIITNYADPSSIYTYDVPTGMVDGDVLNILGLTVSGRYVRIWADYPNASTSNVIHFAEVVVNGCAPPAPTCTDGIQNGTETGIDCGGSCPNACGGASGNAWSATTTSTSTWRTGAVHIGKSNTTPGPEAGYNLYVTGGIKSEKVKIELPSTGGWADYIFKKDYHLLPIKEVERFIKSHQHLPDFPSESSLIKAGGYEIGDMMKRQQVGLESLYLYIIELEKKVERMKVLEKRVAELERSLRLK